MARAGRGTIVRYGYNPIPRPQLFLLTLTGVLTLAGSNISNITFIKLLNGSISLTGNAARAITFIKLLSGSIEPSSSLVFQYSLIKLFTGDLLISSDIWKVTSLDFDGSVSFSSTVDDLLVLTLGLVGSLTPGSGVISQIANKTLNSDISFSSDVSKNADLNLNSYLTFESNIQKASNISLYGYILLYPNLNRLVNAIRIISGSINPISTISKQTSKALDGHLTPSGGPRKQIARVLAGILHSAGSFVKQRVGDINSVSASISIETIINVTMSYEDTSVVLSIDGI